MWKEKYWRYTKEHWERIMQIYRNEKREEWKAREKLKKTIDFDIAYWNVYIDLKKYFQIAETPRNIKGINTVWINFLWNINGKTCRNLFVKNQETFEAIKEYSKEILNIQQTTKAQKEALEYFYWVSEWIPYAVLYHNA